MQAGLSLGDIAELDLGQLQAITHQMSLDAKAGELQARGVSGQGIVDALAMMQEELYPEQP